MESRNGVQRRASNATIIIEAPIDHIVNKLIDKKYAITRETTIANKRTIQPRAITK
jgi:hypothetical protein